MTHDEKMALHETQYMDNNGGNPPPPPMVSSLKTLALRAAAIVTLSTPYQAWAQLDNNVPDVTGKNIGGSNLKQAIVNIVKYILTFVAIIAVAVIVFAGIRFIISAGEEGEKEKAKKMIIYAVIGLLIIMLAQAIVNFVIGLN